MVKVKEDLTGRTFARLTVIKQVEDYISPKGKHRSQWLCECNCLDHNKITTTGNSLKSGKTKSCGCLNQEMIFSVNKKYNKYDLSGEYGVGFTSNSNSYGRREFYFDLEDYDKIKDYCWYFTQGDYVRAWDGKSKTHIKLHNLILPTENGYIPDHIHGKKSRNDNRKSNLRVVNKSKNGMNSDFSKRNTSGVVGVYWKKETNKWFARITVNYKTIHLGYFDSFEDAVKARKKAEEKYFGEFSYEKSQAM